MQGTDGLSRGNLFEGVLSGADMLSFIPINQTALERCDDLLAWFRSWTNEPELVPLSPKEWLWKGQGLSLNKKLNSDGIYLPTESNDKVMLWTPQPCIADVALEYLRKSIHKRPSIAHIFVVPKLMTYSWRKHALKNCDFSFYIDAGVPHWPSNQHESLLICLFLPHLHCRPWTFKGSNKVLALERKMRQVQRLKNGSERAILLQLWSLIWKVQTMPHGVVWKVLSESHA